MRSNSSACWSCCARCSKFPPCGRQTLRGAAIFSKEEYRQPESKRGIYPPLPFGPTEIDLDSALMPPLFRKPADRREEANDGVLHLLGTDNTGRDVLTLLLYGTRISMTVGFVSVGIYVTVGIILGALPATSAANWTCSFARDRDRVVVSLVLLDPDTGGPDRPEYLYHHGGDRHHRLADDRPADSRRGAQTGAIDYTTAAQALGSSRLRIVFRHILPNSLSPALVAAPFGIAGAIITEAGLSLLGFGVRPPTPTWGTLLRLGNGNYHYWWLIVVPSVAIFITVTVFNLVGNGLRDAMDPKLRI